MNSLLKKTLIAAAISGVSMTASAATWDAATTETLVSTEALGVFAEVASTELTVALAAEYTPNDEFYITFDAAALDPTSFANTITVAADQGGVDTLYGMTLQRLETTATDKVVYRVSSLLDCTDAGGVGSCTTVGVDVTFDAAPEFVSATVLSNEGVAATFTSKTSMGTTIETIAAQELFTVSNQFSLVTAVGLGVNKEFDGVVDVNNDRQVFYSTGGHSATVDVAAAQFTDNTGALDTAATLVDVTYTVTGDFSWIADLPNAFADGVIAIGGCTVTAASRAVTATTLTFECTDAVDPTVTIDTAANGGDVTLPTQTFTVSAVVTYDDGAGGDDVTKNLAAVGLGSWGINASQTFIPYMPYNDVIGQIINITNKFTGDVTGDAEYAKITVDVMEEDGTVTTLTNLGQASPGITVLAQDLKDAMAAAGLTVTGSTTRYALTIIINAAATDIAVYSAYNANGNDRGYVQNQ